MKKVLFVTYDFPYPTSTGGKNRAYNMLKHSKNIKKYLFSFTRDDFKQEYQQQIENLGIEVVEKIKRKKTTDFRNFLRILRGESIFKSLYYDTKTAQKLINHIHDKKIDIVHYESYYTGFYITDEIKDQGVKQVFGTENVEHLLYESYAKKTNPLFYKLIKNQVSRIQKEEENMMRKADLCLAVSESDAAHIKKIKKCEIVENGVDLSVLKFKFTGDKKGKRLLFVGNFNYFPNVDAINYFYKEIFTKLPSSFRLLIIGKAANLLKIDKNRVEIREFIKDISEAYHETDIVVAPVRIGGGTNFKILEAWACGTPVISLPERLVGLKITKDNILIAENSSEFIDKITMLSNDLMKRQDIAKAARKTAEEEYSWEIIGKKLVAVWESL